MTPLKQPAPVADWADRYGDELFAYLRQRVRCPHTAADLLQQTWERLVSLGDQPTVYNARALLYRMASNLLVDHLRRRQVRQRYAETLHLDNADASTPTLETVVEAEQRLDRLWLAIDQLPPRCREVFLLRKFEDLEHNEIARRLGISRSTVEKHLRYAVVFCRRFVDGG